MWIWFSSHWGGFLWQFELRRSWKSVAAKARSSWEKHCLACALEYFRFSNTGQVPFQLVVSAWAPIMTIQRSHVWRDPETLWRQTQRWVGYMHVTNWTGPNCQQDMLYAKPRLDPTPSDSPTHTHTPLLLSSLSLDKLFLTKFPRLAW